MILRHVTETPNKNVSGTLNGEEFSLFHVFIDDIVLFKSNP
jgi:hypothetical protein